MRIDAVTIFPDYFEVLKLSLLGKAQSQDLLEIRVHDLREYTDDKHRSVDDTPFGGGAGMLMKPEPWGRALDELVTDDSVVIFPTPAGQLFTQKMAQDLAKEKHLIFACGRYEGIDQRVVDYAATKAKVLEVSLGDYVLNGGEVAAIAMTEAIGRLIPGVIGNASSLEQESHQDGLLEYPNYTKPSIWRGLTVPEVLLSGNHAEIEKFRLEQAKARTKAVRPDLAD